MEEESALVDYPNVAEAAVIGKQHEIKGQAICAFVSLKVGFDHNPGLVDELRGHVAKKIGPVDIALVSIGAYLPRDVMKAVHMTPEESLVLARIMGAKTAIAMHWGTLPLGDARTQPELI